MRKRGEIAGAKRLSISIPADLGARLSAVKGRLGNVSAICQEAIEWAVFCAEYDEQQRLEKLNSQVNSES